MNCCKKRRSFISLVCAILLVLSIISVPVSADGLNRVTASTGASVTQGDYAYCYVYIDSAEGLAALDVTVHYDPSRVQIVSTYNSLSCTLYDSATDADSIRFSYILDGQGSTEKTRLFYFRYRVLSGACVGEAYFDITVGEAYDSALNEMAVYGSRCRFTIMESVPRKNCSIYGSRSAATAVGQEFTLSYRLSTREIASGTVVITYDSELFRVVGVTNGAFLSGKVADINTDLTGEIYISFAGTEYSSATDLISVTFRTLCNVSETSEIRAVAKELLDKGLNAYTCTGYTTAVTVAYDEKYTGDSPSMRLDGTFSYEDKQITLTVSLEAGSRLGAGDFVIGFDPELVTYRSCNKGFAPSFFNVNDKNTDSGELKFNIISLSDIVMDETVLTVVFDVNWPYSGKTADFTLSGTGLTDSMTEGILLNFIDDSVWLEYRVSFLDEDGTLLQSNMYHYGDKVTAPEAPTKESDVYGSYTFSGWDNPVTDCIADAIYTATYTTEYIDYTVIFKDWDGTELSRKTYHYGDKVAVPEAPVREKDSTYTYTFAGWDSEVVACNGNATYTATYTIEYIDYTIIFKDWDGTELSRKTYHYGDKVTIPESPTKESDVYGSYTFSGWDKPVTDCIADATYTATYTTEFIDYTIIFKDWDGTELSRKTYHYGDKVTAPEAPIREKDSTYTFTFAGWDSEVVVCNGNATYTATYTKDFIDYTVIFKDWDGTELSRKTYHYGDKVTAPEAPIREKDSTYAYTFAGWDSEVVACNGNATYTATYDADYLGFLISGTVACLGATDGEITIRLLQNNAEVVSVVSADGTYSLLAPEPGDYILSVSKPDCVTKNYEITVERENILLNLEIYLIGDLNCDGEIAAADALMALQIAVGKLRPTEDQAKAADVDGEGGVTATDALLILQYAVGKIKKFPVKQIA